MEMSDCEVAVREAKKAIRAELLAELYRMMCEDIEDIHIIEFMISKLRDE